MPYQPSQRAAWRDASAVLLLGVRFIWPWFAFVGFLSTAHLFGEAPDRSQQLSGALSWAGAIAFALLAPLVARSLAAYRKAVRVVATVEVVIVSSVVIVAMLIPT